MTTRNSQASNKSANTGLSLVELMISILLGLLLSSGIIAVYLESKRNFAAEEELARIQENGRFALGLLKRELSLAGFFGGYFLVSEILVPTTGPDKVDPDCASPAWALDINPSVDLIDNFSSSLVTVDGTTLDCLTIADIEPGTDVFTVKRSTGEATVYEGIYADGVTAAKNKQMYLRVEGYGDEREWKYNDTAGFSDVDPNDPIEYWEMHASIFFIRSYAVATGDGIPTLCVVTLVGKTMEERCLVEGVEDMQIVFGEDTDGDSVPNQYVSSPTDLDAAVTARIYLLMRSVNELSGTANINTKTYTIIPGSTPVTFNDNYLRRIFSTTVLMRNSILPAG